MTQTNTSKPSIEGPTVEHTTEHASGEVVRRILRNLKPRPPFPNDPESLIDEDVVPNASPTASIGALDTTTRRLEDLLGPRGRITSTLNSTLYDLENPDCRENNGLGEKLLLELNRIRDQVKGDLRHLQMVFSGQINTNVKSPREAVVTSCTRKVCDPVFAYTIACHCGLKKVLKEVASKALKAYTAHADEYGIVLRDLIPQKLNEKAGASVARRKYAQGSNPTARQDWDVFLAQSKEAGNGLPTGLPGLDDALGGGVSGLTILGANEGDGKTSLVLKMMVSALRADKNLDCLLLAIDQPKRTTLSRLRCLVTGCDKWTLELPPEKRDSELNRQIDDGIEELQDSLLPRMRLVEKSNLPVHEAITPDTLLDFYRGLNHATQATSGIVAIDMFQSLDRFPDSVALDNDRDDYRLDVIMRFMQRTRSSCCPDGFPVVTTSEIRKVDRVKLTSNDLRGSARLGSLAINILLLWPPENTNQYAEAVPRILNVAKSRPGEKAVLQLLFHHTICRFTEMPVAEPAARGGIKDNGVRTRGLDSRNAL